MSVSVPVEFYAEFTEALKDFNEFSKKLKPKTEKVEDDFNKIGLAIRAAVAYFSVSKIISGLEAVTAEAVASESAMKELAGQLQASGEYSKTALDNLEDFAKQMARSTKYTDDMIVSQLAVAKRFNTTNTEAKKLVQTAADLSASTGGRLGLAQAVELLGKSLDGTAGKLVEMFPEMRNLTAEQLTNAGAIDLLAKKYGGFANREAKDFVGAQANMSKGFADFKKEIGNLIIRNQAVISVLQIMGEAFRDLGAYLKENGSAISDFITGSIEVMNGSFFIVISTIRELHYTIESMIVALTDFGRRIVAQPQLIMAYLAGVTGEYEALISGLDKALADDTAAAMKRVGAWDSILTASAKVSLVLEDQKKTTFNMVEDARKIREEKEKEEGTHKRISAELKKQYQDIVQRTKTLGATRLEQLDKEYRAQIKIINDYTKYEATKNKEAQAAIAALTRKYNQEVFDEKKKLYDEEQARITEFFKKNEEAVQSSFQNPLAGAFKAVFGNATNFEGLTLATQKAIASGLGILSNVLQGRQGAVNLAGQLGEMAGKFFLGVPGMGEVVKLLAQGPEKVKEMVKEFADAVPDIIIALTEAIPAVIEALADKFSDPDFLTRLATAIGRAALLSGPMIAQAMVNAALKFGAKILEGAGRFLTSIWEGAGKFVDKILEGAGQFIQRLIDGIANIGGNLFGGGGGGGILGGGIGSAIGGAIAGPVGAIGGAIFGGGFSFKGGESDYPTLAAKGGAGTMGSQAVASADGGTKSVGGGQNVMQIVLQVDRKNFASVMLDINRLGLRTI